jgi:hypothetical protein
MENEEVVIEPAAEHESASALRQITPALIARHSGVHSATAASKAGMGVIG